MRVERRMPCTSSSPAEVATSGITAMAKPEPNMKKAKK